MSDSSNVLTTQLGLSSALRDYFEADHDRPPIFRMPDLDTFRDHRVPIALAVAPEGLLPVFAICGALILHTLWIARPLVNLERAHGTLLGTQFCDIENVALPVAMIGITTAIDRMRSPPVEGMPDLPGADCVRLVRIYLHEIYHVHAPRDPTEILEAVAS